VKVVVLAGGLGTRLGLIDRPKAMVSVDGTPLLERLLVQARDSGFADFLFLTGHMADVISDHFGDGARFGVRIDHVPDPRPLGTAGAVREARHLLTEPFVVLYGDTLMGVDLQRMVAFHRQRGGLGTLFVHPNDHPGDSDLLRADSADRIAAFLPKPHAAGAPLPNLVSAALYVLDPAAIDDVPADGASDWGRDVFPAIVRRGGQLNAYRSVEYIKDIGTPSRLARGEADLASGRVARLSARVPKPAIFLDRDGVLNEEIGGVHAAGNLRVIPGAGAALRKINLAGVPAICVTNQPDLAKGMMSAADLSAVHDMLDTALAQESAYLDDLLFCPHHPDAGWPGEVSALKVACECRKPLPGLLFRAAERHGIDLSRSWMIGDRYADIAAGRAAGTRTILLQTGHAGSDYGKYPNLIPDFICSSLDEAVEYALK